MVPQAIASAVERWKSAGQPAQETMAWPRARWITSMPEYETLLTSLPADLDRERVRFACNAATLSEYDAISSFLATMVWGYGTVGFGPFRTKRILNNTPGAGKKLLDVARATKEDGPLAGYQLFITTSRLQYLGPAFGTKFLFFVSDLDRPALIFDALVAKWLEINTDLRMDPVPWRLATYKEYLDVMGTWAEELDVPAADLELCLFTDQATKDRTQWGVRSV